MKHGTMLAVCAAAIAATACASSAPVSETARAANIAAAGEPQWLARISLVTHDRLNSPDSIQDRSYGTARWGRGDRPNYSMVNLVFQFSGSQRDLSWAIVYGNCGSASMTVLPSSNFPELDLSAGGRAEMTATLPMELPISGAYHVEIYKDRQGGAEAVVGCGNFKFGTT